jgi:hypothetical protein
MLETHYETHRKCAILLETFSVEQKSHSDKATMREEWINAFDYYEGMKMRRLLTDEELDMSAIQFERHSKSIYPELWV